MRTSIRCVSCDYILRGLRPSDDCPECGTPVEATILQPLLQHAALRDDESTIRRGFRRVSFIVIALVLVAAMTFLTIFLFL